MAPATEIAGGGELARFSLWQIQKTPKLHRRNERVSEFTYYAASPRVSIPGECVGSILYVCTKVVMRDKAGERASELLFYFMMVCCCECM